MALRASMNNSIRLLRGALGVSSFPSAAYTSPNSWRQLSTSVAAVETPKKTGRRRIIDTKDPIVLTERAADRIKEILSNKHENGESAVGIRIGTKRRGCNGLSYTMNYAFENRRKILKWKPTGLKSILNRWRYSI